MFESSSIEKQFWIITNISTNKIINFVYYFAKEFIDDLNFDENLSHIVEIPGNEDVWITMIEHLSPH